jgi:hypothetical protein
VRDIPDVALMEGALREAFFLPFPGRMVSLLALTRRVPPSVRPDATRSDPAPRVVCGIELTVSVSTVIFFVEGSAMLDLGFKLLNEALETIVLALGVLSGSTSSSFLLRSWSLPLSVPFGSGRAVVFGVVCPSSSDRTSKGFPFAGALQDALAK